MSLKELIKKRSVIKSRLTRFQNNLSLQTSETEQTKLKFQLDTMKSLYVTFNEVQNSIELHDEVNLDEQLDERDAFEGKYAEVMKHADHILDYDNQFKEAQSLTAESSALKLPTIDLPSFDGKYSEWVEYRDTFLSLVHENPTLSAITKYHYLRSSLKGSAAIVLRNLEFSADNYSVAWQLLNDRYHNKRLLVHNHVKALFAIINVDRESVSAIRDTIDLISKNLSALKTLGEPIDTWDTLLIHLITTKLDLTTTRKWEEYRPYDKIPTLDIFLQFLRNRANVLETMIEDNPSRRSARNAEFAPKSKVVSVITTTDTGDSKHQLHTQLNCKFCKGTHPIYFCEKFQALSVEERIKCSERLDICTNCLRSGHRVNECQSRGCKVCNRKHNTLFHLDSQANSKSPVILSVEAVQPGHAMLGTALVQVVYNNKTVLARVLLDVAAQCSLITQSLCEKLDIEPSRSTHTIRGALKSAHTINEYCEIEVQSRISEFSIPLSCIAVPEIVGSLPNQSHDVLTNILIPKEYQLADPEFATPAAIDILIGAEWFWSIICHDRKSLGTNKPFLVDSKFGWLVSGPTIGIQSANRLVCNVTISPTRSDADQLTRSRKPEIPQSHDTMIVEEVEYKRHQNATTRSANGHYSSKIPMEKNPQVPGDSYIRRSIRSSKRNAMTWRNSSRLLQHE